MSIAETKIATFSEPPNTANTLIISPEAAQQAGKHFTELCNDQLLQHADKVKNHEANVIPYSLLDKETAYADGSTMKVRVISRSGRLPEDHPYKDLIKDAPFEIQVRSWTGSGDDLQIQESHYEFDEQTGTVRKILNNPMDDIKRALSIADAVELEALANDEFDTVDEAVEDALGRELEHALEGQKLERELGLDQSILVGPDEVAQLRALAESVSVADVAK
jgi:hypothetical protein